MSQLYEITTQTEGSGTFMMGVAGEALGKHKLVYRAADSLWHLADANATTTMIVYGLTLEAISIGLNGKILLSGYVADVAWSWVVGGVAGIIYASGTPGELTQTPPGLPTDTVQGVAVALTDQAILFSPPGYMLGGGGGPVAATAYGTATVVSGNTYIAVTHGLGGVPTSIKVTPSDELGARDFWVDTVGAATFRINISMVDLSNGHGFYWEASL